MEATSADELVQHIKEDMRQNIKAGKHTEVAELRSLLARISNAEAVPIETGISGHEAQRRLLDLDDLKSIIAEEESEIQSTILALDAELEYVAELKKKLAIIQRYK